MNSTKKGPSEELIEKIKSAREPSTELMERLGLGKILNVDITDDRIQSNIPALREAVGYWKAYPDKFIEFLAGENSKFKFYSYQRIMLRAALRHKYVFMTFPRAYSKSFISVMSLMVKAMLYPGLTQFTAANGKAQAADILGEKVKEICELIPAFKKEIDWKESKFASDYTKIVFYNNSIIDVVAAQQSTRGKRRQAGLFEEVILFDGTIVNEVLVPLLNISRRCADGTIDENDKANKSQTYITTAGWKGTYAYQKAVQTLIWQIIKPGTALSLGGTWRTPVLCGLLDKSFLKDIREDETFEEASFEREY